MAVGCASTSPWDLLEWSQFLGRISCRMTVKQDKLGKKDAFLKQVYMGVSVNGGTPQTPQNDHF